MKDLADVFYKQWEKMFSSFMEQLVHNKSFLAQMGKVMEGSNIFKMIVDKSIIRGLETMQMPTRRDMEETLGVLRKLEMAAAQSELRMTRLEEKLDALAGAVAALAGLAAKQAESAAAAALKKAAPKKAAPRKPAPKKTAANKPAAKRSAKKKS